MAGQRVGCGCSARLGLAEAAGARKRRLNEAATLAFVAANTTIPVPPCRLYTQDGLLHLESKRITAGALLEEIDRERRAAAAAAADAFHFATTTSGPRTYSSARTRSGSSVSLTGSLPGFPLCTLSFRCGGCLTGGTSRRCTRRRMRASLGFFGLKAGDLVDCIPPP